MPGICGNCFKVSAIGWSMECACGHKTSYEVAGLLYHSAFGIGKRQIKMALIKRLEKIMKKSGGLSKISLFDVPLKISEEKFFNDVGFDVTKFVDEKAIERVGLKFIEPVVEREREELEKILGQKVELGAAAQVIAYLYDGETDKHARIVVQKISDLKLHDFYLGEKVAAQNKSGLVYLPRVATSVIVAIGSAELAKEGYHEYELAVVSKATYPLGIIVRTSEIGGLNKNLELQVARLFIFV